ncbi:glycosyltransferase [Alloiococcus sp. CFN-8]|uniref:glycosyltransferase n=1 Tax=Alloiococcus sp. CFN-8 TaxID=3416081 RepID=UPI003CF1ACA6
MGLPLVSICIPTYNSANFLERTLDSVLKQSYKNLEIVIVDDCSQDNTVEIVKKYTDPRVRLYINDKNKGLTGNWNRSVEEASGEYIKLLCADDIIYEHCVEKEVEAFKDNPIVSMVVSNTHIVNSQDKITLKQKKLSREGVYSGKTLAKKSIRFKNYYGAPCSTLFKKELFQRIGGFDNALKLIPDFDLWLRLSYEGDIYFIDEYLSAFRVHSVSNTNKLMNGGKDTYAEEHILMVKKHMDYNKIPLSSLDLWIHKLSRKIRSFMLAVFVNKLNN